MISSVTGLSYDKCKRIGCKIAQAVVAHREAAAVAAGLHPSPSFAQRQSAETNTKVLNNYVPTQAKLEEIERVVLDEDDTLMDTEEPEDDDEDTLASLVT